MRRRPITNLSVTGVAWLDDGSSNSTQHGEIFILQTAPDSDTTAISGLIQVRVYCMWRKLKLEAVGSKPIINLQPALGTVCSLSGRLTLQVTNALA